MISYVKAAPGGAFLVRLYGVLGLVSCLLLPGHSLADKRNDAPIETIDLRNISVGDVLKMLSEQTGRNFVASEKASNIKVALFLHHMRPMDVIDTIARTYNLWYQEDPVSRVVRLYTPQEFRQGEVGSQLEGQTEIFTLRYPNAVEVAYAIRDLYSSRVMLDVGTLQMNDTTMELRQRFNRFDVMGSRQQSIGGGQGNTVGGASGGGGGGTTMSPNQNAQGSQENKNTMVDVSREGLTGMLSGSQAEGAEALSGHLQQKAPIYVTVLRAQNRILVRTQDPQAMQQIRDLVRRLDMGSATLLMEVRIYSVALSDDLNSVFNLYSVGGSVATSMIPGIQAIGPAASAFDSAKQGLMATVMSKNLQASMELLEKEGRLTALATPVLVTQNQEVSRVFVGSQVPIVTGYTSSNNGVGAASGTITNGAIQPILVPVTELRNIGTTLTLTPSINADRTVSIRLLIEQSTVGAPASIPVALGNNIENANVDTVTSSSYVGAVVSKDSLAVAVGGLISESTKDTLTGVPLLMDIPWLGNLFKETVKKRTRNEIIMVIRPFIQSTPTEAADENDRFVNQESQHPAVGDFDRKLDLYKRPADRPNDYDLTPGHKLFPYQDSLKSP